jgi:hypothetical protein
MPRYDWLSDPRTAVAAAILLPRSTEHSQLCQLTYPSPDDCITAASSISTPEQQPIKNGARIATQGIAVHKLHADLMLSTLRPLFVMPNVLHDALVTVLTMRPPAF